VPEAGGWGISLASLDLGEHYRYRSIERRETPVLRSENSGLNAQNCYYYLSSLCRCDNRLTVGAFDTVLRIVSG
jgi:hypothetical protein